MRPNLRSGNVEDEDDDSEEDFLGQPRRSDSVSPSSGSFSNGSVQPEEQPRATNRRQPRKQAKPKKRIDRAFQEVVKLRHSTKLLIPKLPFQRLVREILQQTQQVGANLRVQSTTLECLQEAAESYLTTLFEDSCICSLHRSRATTTPKDMRLVAMLRGQTDPAYKIAKK